MRNNKIANGIIAVFFIGLLLIPVFAMNHQDGKISEAENRTLTSFPQVFDKDGHLTDGLKDRFESWWGDNLGFRSSFVELVNSIRLKMFRQSTSSRVEIGRDGWYFLRDHYNIELAAGEYTLPADLMEDIAEKQQRISDWYASEGIEYLLVLTPAKTSIYPEYIASGDYDVRDTICDQVEQYLRQNTTVNVLNTKSAFLENKESGKLFLQHDSHCTQLGTYLIYQAVAERLQEMGFEMEYFPVDFENGQSKTGDIAKLLGSPYMLGSETVPNAIWEQSSTAVKSGEIYDALVQAREETKSQAVLLENDAAKNGTVLIYSDSQWDTVRNIPQWLGESFKTVARVKANSLSVELDSTVRPDLVIYGGGERLLYAFLIQTVGIPKLTDELPTLPYKDMISSDEYGRWIGNHGICLDTYNGVKNAEEGKIVIDPAAKAVDLYGWAADFFVNRPLKALYLQVGDVLLECEYGIERTGVKKSFGHEELLKVGFQVMFPSSYLQNGRVKDVSFVGLSADGEYLYTPVTYQLTYK